MMVEQQAFFDETTNSWAELIKHIEPLSRSHWLFRGQACDWCLAPTLQRKIDAWGIDPNHAPKLEQELVREFRRRVWGEEQSLVQKDMLNCLALMQHHGAPTRLLDATYSPFVAAQTALREGLKDVPVIWCFNPYWMEKHHDQILGQTERSNRLDALIERTPLLVTNQNPHFLNRRLTAHQGVFLCPGDISRPFVENLKAMIGWNSGENVRKLRLCFAQDERINAVKTLKRINVSSTVLFPGLDGFARSLGEELPHYDEIYASKTTC